MCFVNETPHTKIRAQLFLPHQSQNFSRRFLVKYSSHYWNNIIPQNFIQGIKMLERPQAHQLMSLYHSITQLFLGNPRMHVAVCLPCSQEYQISGPATLPFMNHQILDKFYNQSDPQFHIYKIGIIILSFLILHALQDVDQRQYVKKS